MVRPRQLCCHLSTSVYFPNNSIIRTLWGKASKQYLNKTLGRTAWAYQQCWKACVYTMHVSVCMCVWVCVWCMWVCVCMSNSVCVHVQVYVCVLPKETSPVGRKGILLNTTRAKRMSSLIVKVVLTTGRQSLNFCGNQYGNTKNIFTTQSLKPHTQKYCG